MATERGERKKLQKYLSEHLRDKDRAKLRELRARIHSARVKRRHHLVEAREQCRAARVGLRDRQRLEREEFRDEQRAARADERSVCKTGKETARTLGNAAESAAALELAAERRLQRQVREADQRGRKVRTTARERSQESDDAVRSNLPDTLVPVFDKVKKRIKGGPRRSRTEAFLEWAEENPDEIVALQQAEADEYLAKLLKEQREHGQTMRKAGRYRQEPEKLRAELAAAEVPF